MDIKSCKYWKINTETYIELFYSPVCMNIFEFKQQNTTWGFASTPHPPILFTCNSFKLALMAELEGAAFKLSSLMKVWVPIPLLTLFDKQSGAAGMYRNTKGLWMDGSKPSSAADCTL